MNRLFASAAVLAFMALAAQPMGALAAAEKPAAKAPAKSSAKKKAAPAAKAAPAQEPPEVLSEGQLSVVNRVLVGRADCEFKQSVEVQPVGDKPGHFELRFGKQRFDMVPEETTTGAVRLHDKKADVVWLQIPVKSMLMNQKAGQRMVDACQHAEQRAAVLAVQNAASAAAAAASAAQVAAQAASAAASAASTAVSVAEPASGAGLLNPTSASHPRQ